MKKKISNILGKVSKMSVLNSLALMLVVHSVNACCQWYIYQPEVPEAANRFIKE